MSQFQLRKGTLVKNRYTVEENIKAGGQGAVMKCFDSQQRISVALKIMEANDTKDAVHLNYIKTLAQNPCDFLAPYLDYWAEDKKTYIVMPFYEHDLEDILKKQETHFTQSEIIKYFREIVEGLLHIHKAGLSHKDLKLGNIMLDSSNKIKIVDLSTMRETNRTITAVIYTRLYAAPELFGEKPKHVEASDIYALGVIMMEMIAKVRVCDITTSGKYFPLQEKEDEEKTHGELLLRMDQNKNVSTALKSLAISIIRHDPAVRPSISTIQQVLTAIANGENEQQIISIHKLKDCSKVKPPIGSAEFKRDTASVALFNPHSLKQFLAPDYEYYRQEEGFTKNAVHTIAKRTQEHVTPLLLIEYNCIRPIGPLQLLFNENCVDASNALAIEQVQKDPNYKLFVPNLRVLTWEKTPTNQTFVVIPLIKTFLRREYLEKQKHQQYWTVQEIMNWLQPIVCAVAFMHKKLIIHGSLNMEFIVTLLQKESSVKLLCNYSTFEQLNTNTMSSIGIQEKLKQDIKDLGFILYQMICLQDVSSLPMIQQMKSEIDEEIVHCQMYAEMNANPCENENQFEALKQLVCDMVRYELILTCSIFRVKSELERISQL